MTDYIRGVPQAGHLARNGFWHSGELTRCGTCNVARAMVCPGCGRPRTRHEVERKLPCRLCVPPKEGK
jgi:hypothetical protein